MKKQNLIFLVWIFSVFLCSVQLCLTLVPLFGKIIECYIKDNSFHKYFFCLEQFLLMTLTAIQIWERKPWVNNVLNSTCLRLKELIIPGNVVYSKALYNSLSYLQVIHLCPYLQNCRGLYWVFLSNCLLAKGGSSNWTEIK